MNVTKCESDPDGESFLTSSDSENEPMDMKEEKDHLLMKFSVTNSENECLQNNSDTIKVEREIRLLPHAVDTLIEGDVANNKRDLPLSPVCPLVKCETEVLIMNPGNDGERFSWNHLNLQSEHQLKTDYTSPVQLSEYQNQVLLRRARNAERKRRSRQTRKAKETLEEAAERRAQHAEQVRRWRQSRLATETPQVAASRRAQHAEIMRQWRQSHRSNETPDEAASRRAQQTAQVLVMNPGNDGERLSRSQRNPQSGHRRLNERSKSHVQDSVRRARNAERMRRWRCSRQANETLQDAALRRAQHAEVVRNWRLSRRANETPQVAAPRRAQQTAQVLIVNPGNNGERLSRSQLNPQSQSQERSDDAAPFQLSKSQNQDSLRRARNAERKRRWRLTRQAVETPEDAAARRAQHAEAVRLWRLSRRTNERREGATSRRVKQTAQARRPRTARHPFLSDKGTFR